MYTTFALSDTRDIYPFLLFNFPLFSTLTVSTFSLFPSTTSCIIFCPSCMFYIPTEHQRYLCFLLQTFFSSNIIVPSSEYHIQSVAYPGIFFGGGSTNSVEDRGQRGRGSGGGSPLVRGSGGSCNLVQEISFHIVTFS